MVYIDCDAVLNDALRDCGLHFGDSAVLSLVQIDQGATSAMHDEVTVRTTFLGGLDKLVDFHTVTPGYHGRST